MVTFKGLGVIPAQKTGQSASAIHLRTSVSGVPEEEEEVKLLNNVGIV